MTHPRRFVFSLGATLPLLILLGGASAQAATYKLANTQQGHGSLKVRFCDGTALTNTFSAYYT